MLPTDAVVRRRPNPSPTPAATPALGTGTQPEGGVDEGLGVRLGGYRTPFVPMGPSLPTPEVRGRGRGRARVRGRGRVRGGNSMNNCTGKYFSGNAGTCYNRTPTPNPLPYPHPLSLSVGNTGIHPEICAGD